MTERVTGSHAAVIFLEHLPHTVGDWMVDHPEDIDRMLSQLCDTITFLRGQGISHFDAHVVNVVTDGELICLTDFGLALDKRFDLTARERDFLERHSHYDYGEALSAPWMLLNGWYKSLAPEEQESVRALLGSSQEPADLFPLIVTGVERLEGLVHPLLIAATVRYRDINTYMHDFFARLQANRRKNTPFDDARLSELLRSAGVVAIDAATSPGCETVESFG